MRTLLVAVVLVTALDAAAESSGAETPPATPPPTTDPAPVPPEAKNPLLEQLEHLKFTGYIQARYTYTQGTPPVSAFTVRRARLKPTYTNEWSQYLLELDASPTGVSLREAEATFYEPWTGQKLALTMGQTKWPFAYETNLSSSVREMPERSRVVRAFAPNERDRGAKFTASYGVFKAQAGVFDGNGITTPTDNDNSKDLIGRAGFDLKWLSGGVSGWWGETKRPLKDGGGFFPRNRLGFDAQLSVDPLPLGPTQLRAEYIAGHTYYRSGIEQFGVAAFGWYAVAAQGLGKDTTLAVRYDYFDGGAGVENTLESDGKPSPANAIGTLDVALVHQLTDVIKATVSYEIPVTGVPSGGADPEDNLFTFQLQAKF